MKGKCLLSRDEQYSSLYCSGFRRIFSGCADLNRGPQVPQTCTLNQLRYSPIMETEFITEEGGLSRLLFLFLVVPLLYEFREHHEFLPFLRLIGVKEPVGDLIHLLEIFPRKDVLSFSELKSNIFIEEQDIVRILPG